ncbi:hypothetical protein L596_000130 [Steinernema carpocapsae]|uniref:Uncharacterized protein n=1 Tax=Steinernema carpocapsae TaxID=34508 RepID=A0A4U8UHA7_STECR|nr:hypothetical protein L596_000130 [Steinernema carpocapsae]
MLRKSCINTPSLVLREIELEMHGIVVNGILNYLPYSFPSASNPKIRAEFRVARSTSRTATTCRLPSAANISASAFPEPTTLPAKEASAASLETSTTPAQPPVRSAHQRKMQIRYPSPWKSLPDSWTRGRRGTSRASKNAYECLPIKQAIEGIGPI